MPAGGKGPVVWTLGLVVVLVGAELLGFGLVALTAASQNTVQAGLTYPAGTGSRIVILSPAAVWGGRLLELEAPQEWLPVCVGLCIAPPQGVEGSISSCLDVSCQRLGAFHAEFSIGLPGFWQVGGPFNAASIFLVTVTGSTFIPTQLTLKAEWEGLTSSGVVSVWTAVAGALLLASVWLGGHVSSWVESWKSWNAYVQRGSRVCWRCKRMLQGPGESCPRCGAALS